MLGSKCHALPDNLRAVTLVGLFRNAIRKLRKGLSALGDKTGNVSTKSKDKFCRDKFLSCLRCPHSKFQSGQILSTALIIFLPVFLCRARAKHRTFRRVTFKFSNISADHVQILVLVACFVLLNLAQIADETLLMVCLFLRLQFLRNQTSLLMVEHCRRRPA